jgi:predicted transcriptional regulator
MTTMARPAAGPTGRLSGRERQIMDVLYARGQATAAQVHADLSDPPTPTAIRTFLRILEDKGHVRHTLRGREKLYRPTRPRAQAARSALRRLVRTFFEGSPEKVVAAMLSDSRQAITDQQFDELARLIESARREGR